MTHKDSRNNTGGERSRAATWTRRLLKMTLCLLAIAVLTGAGGFAFIHSGLYSVAATERHAAPAEWALRTAMEKSVRRHAASVVVPGGVDLKDPSLAERAIGHYSVACATCHGAPGRGRDPWVVIYPEGGDLTRKDVVSRWSDRELYWIIKHGIKDTGMLALGPTHKEEDLWAVSAFVRQLPDMTPGRYQELVRLYEESKKESRAHNHH